MERWASAATATAVVAYGVSRGSVRGLALAAAATPLAYRGWVGEWPHLANGRVRDERARAGVGGDRAIDVRESVRLEKPLADVYAFWRQLEHLPRFMSSLDRVRELDGRRSHWVARGPAGLKVHWDAEIVDEIPNEMIAWRSLPGSSVVTSGDVTFTSVRGGQGTQVSVHLRYVPPAGRAGALVATLFGREPRQTIREDLRRLKQLLEAGEVPRTSSSA
ncbi:MAG TPA: SRPBCC family protein [Vicinamibacterales bacterium]|nr:SRPBCC family protein [Vicinamibacterales bacterium]